MEDLKKLMGDNFIKYASYVILERAIPDIEDGLKPVQRRILYTLWKVDDGKMHKVANIAGQTMALHPHGDAPITDALVNIANKDYLLETQGNFGNIFTGDPAAASRYIEARLSPLAKETLFNSDLTQFVPSYDGRNKEPVTFPAKIPLLLLQGADGIAVGMSTHIFPHNLLELLEAEIAILEGREFTLLPDFPTGGIMDASQYDKGRGKIKLRTKFEMKDSKTLIIKEICYGSTTESLIRSIDEAAKKGKIKIEAINDYTADAVEIEIKLPRGQYAEEIQDALYAYTECEMTLHSQVVVIKDDFPLETDVHTILQFHAEKLQEYIRRELEIEEHHLLEKIFEKSLEQIFIENRLYKKIENVASNEKIHSTVEHSLLPFHEQLYRIPTHEDREKLLNIPIRRISKFDIEKNQEEIAKYQKDLSAVQKEMKNIKRATINYLKHIIAKYAKNNARKTEIQNIERLNLRAIETKIVKIGFDSSTGFLGTKVVSDHSFECTNFDKLLIMYKDGTYMVTNIPEKQYVQTEGNKVAYVGVADKKTIINVVYKDPSSNFFYAKRFIVEKFILEKKYRYFDEGNELVFLSVKPNVQLDVIFIPKAKQKIGKTTFDFSQVLTKGVAAKGIRIANREIKKVAAL